MSTSIRCIALLHRFRWPKSLSLLVVVCVSVFLAINAHSQYQILQDQSNIAKLNQKVLLYKQVIGTNPDLNLIDLYHKGYTEQRLHRTPFGGFYRFNPSQSLVYNPNTASQ